MKVLVPLDGSQLAERMLTPALELVEPDGELLLLHAIPFHDHALIDGGAAYLEGVRKRMEEAGAQVRWFLEQGDPAERIVAVAVENDPDLVLMSSHGHRGEEGAVRGSVAERVLRTTRHPLLLANPRADWENGALLERILIAHDGSEFANAVVPLALSLAQTFGSSITLIKVYAQPHGDEGLSELEPVQATIRSAGVSVDLVGTVGSTTCELAREAEGYDLVCLATHGRSGLSRWWFGSVAEGLLRECKRPLLVVRPAPVEALL